MAPLWQQPSGPDNRPDNPILNPPPHPSPTPALGTPLPPSPPPPCSAHPALAKVAFTGSTATGRRVYAAAAANLRPAVMELGGKSALLVFEDADVEKAVEWCMFGVFW